MRMRQYGLKKCHTVFSANCLGSLQAFAAGFLYFYDESEFIVATMSPLREQSFLFEKRYIEDMMVAECCYDPKFRAHFLSNKKRSVR